jgi:hypothetical protein
MKGAKKMKKITVLSVALLAVGLAAFAETETSATIENVVVRQRWPWSKVVDIDFTVRGNATGVKFVAKYDGAEQFVLAEKDLTGDFCDVLEPGLHHVTWDPAKAGLDETELKNFTVSVEPDDTDRTYLILNLYDGSYRYAAAEPEGGWLADPANYQTNIVFRRVPKGTRNIGLTTDFDKKFNASNYAHKREVTLTSDYYLSVFMTTKAQRKYIDGSDLDVSDEGKNYEGRTYPQMRGGQGDGIDWPSTEHTVKPGCIIDKLRNIVKTTFSSDWIVDLPTSTQWEYAAKATTPFDELLSVGEIKVTDEDLYEKFTNNVDLVAIWHHNKAEWGKDDTTIGRKRPNGWGFYDMVGLGFEWCNDWYQNSYTKYSGVNPVGPTSGLDGKRVRRSMYTRAPTNPGMIYYTTAYVGAYAPNDSYKCGYRFCLNLKNMFKGK